MILLFTGLVLFIFVLLYNRLIRLANDTKEAWADVDAQLKRRYDLIGNLAETVKAYAKHEKKLFTDITESRVNAIRTSGIENKEEAENKFQSASTRLLAIAENYPQLRSSENFVKLQDELTDTENYIESARRYYNGTVRELNNALESFPYNLLAGFFGFKKWPFFQLEDEKMRQQTSLSMK